MPRRTEIEAAIATHNSSAAAGETLLPPAAGRLLAVMFRRGSVCQRSLDDLAGDTHTDTYTHHAQRCRRAIGKEIIEVKRRQLPIEHFPAAAFTQLTTSDRD